MDKARKTSNVPPTTLSAAISNTDVTIPLSSTVGVDTSGYIDIVIDRVDGTGKLTPEKMEIATVLISGNNGTNAVRGRTGLALAHDNGAIVEYNISTSPLYNDFVDAFLANHMRSGAFKAGSVVLTALADVVAQRIFKPGDMKIHARSTLDDGWLWCDGAAVSRTTYAELFAAIGTTFGAGNGTTTFNLPDMRGQIPVGLDASQTEFDTLGKSGGQKTVQAHTHAMNFWPTASEGGGSHGLTVSSSYAGRVAVTASPGSSTQPSGVGANNMNPYLTVRYAIKT